MEKSVSLCSFRCERHRVSWQPPPGHVETVLRRCHAPSLPDLELGLGYHWASLAPFKRQRGCYPPVVIFSPQAKGKKLVGKQDQPKQVHIIWIFKNTFVVAKNTKWLNHFEVYNSVAWIYSWCYAAILPLSFQSCSNRNCGAIHVWIIFNR
jgi:hypothetical protein